MSFKELAKAEKDLTKGKRQFITGCIVGVILLIGLSALALFV